MFFGSCAHQHTSTGQTSQILDPQSLNQPFFKSGKMLHNTAQQLLEITCASCSLQLKFQSEDSHVIWSFARNVHYLKIQLSQRAPQSSAPSTFNANNLETKIPLHLLKKLCGITRASLQLQVSARKNSHCHRLNVE